MPIQIDLTDDDMRTACDRLDFPNKSWDIIRAKSMQVAAERMLAENRAAQNRLMDDNAVLCKSNRMSDHQQWLANHDEITRLMKAADELSRVAFPGAYRSERGEA